MRVQLDDARFLERYPKTVIYRDSCMVGTDLYKSGCDQQQKTMKEVKLHRTRCEGYYREFPLRQRKVECKNRD